MKIIGHRGARGLAPENTLASLRRAVEHKADMIEFDVRVTKDSIPILHHDPFLTDPNGDRLKIASASFEELKYHKADLVTLKEVLSSISGTPFYIEVKPKVSTKAIAKVIKQSFRKDIFLASKSQKVLRQLHHFLPDIPVIVVEPWSGVRAHYRARQVGSKVIAMNQHFLWWGFIIGFKNSDWQLYAYTINDPRKARRWARWGLAGIVTDHPELFKK